MKRDTYVLILFAALSAVALFAHLELSPEPPMKGFCSFCNGPYKAMVLGTYAPVQP